MGYKKIKDFLRNLINPLLPARGIERSRKAEMSDELQNSNEKDLGNKTVAFKNGKICIESPEYIITRWINGIPITDVVKDDGFYTVYSFTP